MCGRYTNTVTDPNVIAQAFALETPPDTDELQARYNIAPTQQIMTVGKNKEDRNSIAWMRWGLIPSWAKDPAIGNRMINARAETLAEKPSFRTAYRKRRCLIVADGFYEWRKNDDGSKTPMYIRMKDGALFGLAGLWEQWRDKESDEKIVSCTIITGTPNDLIKPLHHRMAVILPPEHYETWLSRDIQDTAVLQDLLQPYPSDRMVAYAVSRKVNNAAYDSPDVIEPVDA
jgi:putative SOS response-associated peptidase YedK